ncbi:unnamed protein product [Rhizoctonia solani]|uniref:Peptidase C14 caspase domain-containing protein n=1 Tax=Rhizoctonia solani TaxID=456999 RepID=A0A8H3GQU0_9AGAM|nr:unnamed protein product [Rhizoctonia solani]
MPAILQFLLSVPRVAASCPTTEPQAHLSFRQYAIIVETASVSCMRISRCCLARRGSYTHAVSGTKSTIQTIIIALAVLLVLAAIAWAARNIRGVHHSEPTEDRSVTETETSSLLGTRVSSSTTLHDNYRSCRSVATTIVHTPNRSRRGSIKPVLELVTPSESLLGEYGDYVASPIESTEFPPETFTAVNTQSPDSVIRGRASTVTQKAESLNSSTFDRGTHESPTHELNNCQSSQGSRNRTQTQHILPSVIPSNQANELRAQTALCTKIRSSSLVKSLTALVAIQQVTIHVLAIGTSWEGVDDVPRALPGPLHDIEWLRNLFACQKNFQFNSLLNHAATLVAIHRSLVDMLSVAGENDLLVLYFSGHGGKNDSFELYDSTSVNEVLLNDWIVDFRTRTSRNNPVYIIFDFCRPDLVKPNTELASGVNVIWACSPTESALDLKLTDPNNHLPRSCFLLSLVLAIDDVSEDSTASVVKRFTNRMIEFLKVIRGIHCFKAKCRVPWRYCGCGDCSVNKLCMHDTHKGNLPFQVVSVGGIEGDSNLSAVVQYIASRFPLNIKRAADRMSKDHWVLYFNPSHVSANRRPLNPRNHRLGINMGIEANTVRHMTIPVKLLRF